MGAHSHFTLHVSRMLPAISTTALTHRYGATEALRGVTLEVKGGAFFGLFGPNGAGKTTLIRILATLIIPTSGQAQVNGYDVVRGAAQVRASLGLVFSNENSFYGRLTGQQNLEFFAALQNLSARNAQQRTAELLEFFDLTHAARLPVQTYSTGMKQKLNVARALLHNPPIIFLDEPTKGMDVLTAENLRDLLKMELVEKQGKTILLTTHDLQEMEQLCDEVAILERGSVRAVGTPTQLIEAARPTVIYRLEIAGHANGLVPELARLPGVHAAEVVSQSATATVLDLTLADLPNAELWAALATHGTQVKRLAPKEDGLVRVLKTSVEKANPKGPQAS